MGGTEMKNDLSFKLCKHSLLTEQYINTRQLSILNSIQVDKICQMIIKKLGGN